LCAYALIPPNDPLCEPPARLPELLSRTSNIIDNDTCVIPERIRPRHYVCVPYICDGSVRGQGKINRENSVRLTRLPGVSNFSLWVRIIRSMGMSSYVCMNRRNQYDLIVTVFGFLFDWMGSETDNTTC
jgi:hypothetical protein